MTCRKGRGRRSQGRILITNTMLHGDGPNIFDEAELSTLHTNSKNVLVGSEKQEVLPPVSQKPMKSRGVPLNRALSQTIVPSHP